MPQSHADPFVEFRLGADGRPVGVPSALQLDANAVGFCGQRVRGRVEQHTLELRTPEFPNVDLSDVELPNYGAPDKRLALDPVVELFPDELQFSFVVCQRNSSEFELAAKFVRSAIELTFAMEWTTAQVEDGVSLGIDAQRALRNYDGPFTFAQRRNEIERKGAIWLARSMDACRQALETWEGEIAGSSFDRYGLGAMGLDQVFQVLEKQEYRDHLQDVLRPNSSLGLGW